MAASRAPRLGAFAALAAASLFWAGNYVLGAAAVATIDPLSLLLLRWLLAAVPLFVLAQLLERPDWRQLLRAWPWLAALSGFGVLGYNLLLYVALRFTDAFSASVVNAFNPALISLAAVLFLGARLGPAAVCGTGLALLGVLAVLSGGDPAALAGAGFGPGELLMCGAILCWTGYTVVGRRGPDLPPVASTACQAGIAVAVLSPLAAASGGVALPTTAGAAGALLFIAVFPTVLSYLLWNRALAAIPPAQAGVFMNLITVFTALIAVAGGQRLGPAEVAGGAAVLAGVALANRDAFRADPRRAAGRGPAGTVPGGAGAAGGPGAGPGVSPAAPRLPRRSGPPPARRDAAAASR